MTVEEQTPPISEDVSKSYFLPRLSNSLGVGDKSWSSFIESSSWDAVQRFIEQPDDLTVMFYLSGSELMATKKPPPKGSNCSSKILYFLKLQPTTLSNKDSLSSSSDTSSIITGEINPSSSIIRHMATLAQHVIQPLITTSNASASTPTLATSKELKEATYEFTSAINIASEALNNKVLLIMPLECNDGIGNGTGTGTGMEASVSWWTKQIREAVDETLPDWIKENGLHNQPHLLSIADYWVSRATKLSDVNTQLMGSRAKRVVALLEKAKSPCLAGFTTVKQKLGKSLDKADEMSGYMSQLRALFKELVSEDTGFGEDLTSLYRPVMHTLMLVWKLHPHNNNNNNHFSSSTYHLMEILSAIQDALVQQAQQYIGSIVALLNGDATEGLEMLSNVQYTLAAFKNVCFEYSSRINAECSPDKAWNLTNNGNGGNNRGVFDTVDQFMERCHGAQNICKAALSFARLEKIDIGGEDGELLTKNARSLHAEFVSLLAQLRTADNCKEEELLNPHSKEGGGVFVEFKERQRLLEKRLSVLLGAAMIDGEPSSSPSSSSPSVATILRIYKGFEGLVDHSTIISQDMEARLEKVMRQFVRELLDARTIFDRKRHLPPLPRGAAPQSGSLMWARSLMHRVEGPMQELKELPFSKTLFECVDGQEAVRLYNALVHSVMEFECQLLQQWIHSASELSMRSLSQPVLTYHTTSSSSSLFGSIMVNFDPALMQLVQEVDGFLLLQPLQKVIPEPILKLHSNAGFLRQHVSSLNWVASTYIDLKKGLSPVEAALLHPRLHITDQLIAACLKGDLTWQSADLADILGQLSQGAHSVATGLAATRFAINKIKDTAGKWQQGWNLLNSSSNHSGGGNSSGNKMLMSIQASALIELNKRRMAIQADVDHIQGFLDLLRSELKELTPSSPAWQGFLNSVSIALVYDMTAAVTAAIHCLLPPSTQQQGAEQQNNAVLQEATNASSSLPCRGVKILLDIDPGEDSTIYFVPPILSQKHQLQPASPSTTAAVTGGNGGIKQSGKTLESVVTLCISAISSMGDSIYQPYHHHHSSGGMSKAGGEGDENTIDEEQRVTFGGAIRRDPKIAAAKEWATAQLKIVANQGHQVASQFDRYTFLWEEDMLQALDDFVALNSITDSCDDPDKQTQSFKAFEAEIAKYNAIQREIQQLPSVVDYGWIALDCFQVKQAALMAASKWSFVFLEHLRSHIVGNVHRAYSFIEQASTTLNSDNDATGTVPSSRRGSIAARSSSNRITQSPGLGTKTGTASPISQRQPTASIQHGSRQSLLSRGGADDSAGQGSSSRGSKLGNQGSQRPSVAKRASSSLVGSKRQSVNDGSNDPQTKRRSSTLIHEGSGSKRETLNQENKRQSVVVGTTLPDRRTSTSGRKSVVMLSANPVLNPQQKELYDVLSCMREVKTRKEELTSLFEPLSQAVTVLDKLSNGTGSVISSGAIASGGGTTGISPELQQQIQEGPAKLRSLEKKAFKKREELASLRAAESIEVRRRADRFVKQLEAYRTFFLKKAPFDVHTNSITKEAAAVVTISGEHVSNATGLLFTLEQTGMDGRPSLVAFEEAGKEIHNQQELLELSLSDFAPLTACREDLTQLRELWTVVSTDVSVLQGWSGQPWKTVQIEMLLEEIKRMTKEVKTLPKNVKSWTVFATLETMLRETQEALPLIADLSHPAMRPRHWGMLAAATTTSPSSIAFTVPVATTLLGYLLSLNLHKHVETVADVVDRAQKELTIEKALDKIESTWNSMPAKFDHAPLLGAVALTPAAAKVPLFFVDEAMKESLENDALTLQTMSSGRYVQGHPVFSRLVEKWQRLLADVDAVMNTWEDVQKRWQAMRAIFSGSADIRKQLPEQCVRFDKVDQDFKSLMSSAAGTGGTATAGDTKADKLLDVCSVEGRLNRLQWQLMELESCEKALQNYLETKRIAFPRFYFMSPSDLLDLLARGADPHAVTHHLSKIFDNLHALEWQKDSKTGKPTNVAVGMFSGEKEYVPFGEPCKCDGPVELWLGSLVHAMKHALKLSYRNAMPEYEEMSRADWIFKHPAQTAVIASRTHFTNEIEQAFAELEDGNEEALPRALERQKTHLSQLIEVINGDMSKNDRKKAITLCTIDVHARDVLSRLIENRSESSDSFQWQSQLRYVTDEETGDCKVLICDAEIDYQYEYIGNCGCLCITPLTDRCYITLTQAQKLILGGAPAGPAGTGKTETTKDLARALGLQCYVFNCSDQMDYKAMGQIYKGLAQTGAWGCFDEFNRIPVSVLSVCSTQYKSVLDALRAKKDKFMFEGNQISLKPSTMAFITMNPGYAGRAELPESLKALFRPVSMAAPDLSLICEIMLMAEGFQNSHILARKFIILYRLCEDLLSKAQHYDWKLRAIKTTLYVAGGMKRAAPHLSEDKILLRALRDFNLGKLTQDDAPVFLGLLDDLFPKTLELVPRAVDVPFEAAIKEAALELGYRPDPTFCLKVGQLREIFSVRWSVFLLGPAGAGKTAIWKTLARAQEMVGEKTVFKIINPKAVTTDELYGSLHPTNREWREGLLSSTFRDFAAASSSTTAGAGSGSVAAPKHQWIILDGDIDPEWIESMNTVMDDNKMLTLASNERIPLTTSMKLLLEINHMKHCSPATVTRGGVVYVNADDVGWKPVADSWVEKLQCKKETKAMLNTLLAKYVENTLEFVKKMCKVVVELPAVNQVQTLCKLMDSMMYLEENKQQQVQDVDRKTLEAQFVYACVWALGGNVTAECRSVFSNWWIATFKSVPFPGIASSALSSSITTTTTTKTRYVGTSKQPRTSSSAITNTSTPTPGGETVFDYFVDKESSEMICWSSRLPTVKPVTTIENVFVPTIQTAALNNVLSLLIKAGHNTMLVGGAGSGKSALLNQQLQSLNTYDILQHSVYLNSHLTGPALQQTLELPLEKRVGTRYGASGNRRMLYFLKGLNMPKVDKYETQTALELVRQSIDAGGWYGKPSSGGGGNKVTFKEIQSLQYVATMNPSSGSFTVTPRMQRQFATFAVHMPGTEELKNIYSYILEDHFTTKHGFKEEVVGLVRSSSSNKGVLLEAVVDLYQAVVAAFPPSAVNFTYQITLREITGVVRGLCRANPAVINSSKKLLRLWTHESDRVYGDRMADVGDKAKYEDLRRNAAKKVFSGIVKALVEIEAKPLLFADFMHVKESGEDDDDEENAPQQQQGVGATAGGGQTAADVSSIRVYEEVSDYDCLHKVLYKFVGETSSNQQKNGATAATAAADHQDNRQHNLVLFPEASQHVVSVARALSTGQHPLLIGPGGSGRQSLARLAAKVAGFEAVSLASAADYALPQFISDLVSVYQKTGVKNIPCALILTDSQLSHDSMLVPLNDLLATAEHAGLCSNSEDKDAICAAVKNEARAAGVLDTPAQLWDFFLSRVRANLRIVLCASPVGDRLRVWARRFPALMSSMAFDTFGGWPCSALCAVSQRLLLENRNSPSTNTTAMPDGDISAGPLVLEKSQVESVSEAAAAIHQAVAAACVKYWTVHRRRAYVTPKSFLELVSLYNSLLKQKREELKNAKLRLQNGVLKISEARSAVLLLQKELEKEQVVVEEKKAAADALVESLGVEKAAADVAVEAGKGDETAAIAIQEEVSSAQSACAADLEKAEPIIKEAEAALNSLDKASLGELKSFSKPAPDIVAVVAACMVLTAPSGKPVKDLSWPAAKRWMGDVNALLKSLVAFDKENVPVSSMDRVEHEFVSQQGFQPDLVRTKSFAAAGLCSWVINICKYSRIYAFVAPKRAALAEANSRLDDSNRRLAGARSHVAGLLSKVAALQDELAAATAAKNAAIAQAEKTASKAALAENLISGLAGEYVRWQASIEALAKQEKTIVGDALLSAAFVAYAGAFNTPLRRELVNQHWLPQIQKKNIPIATSTTSSTSSNDGKEIMHSKGDGNNNNSGEGHGPDGMSLVLEFLITARDKACWIQEGLPTDSHSQENAAIVDLCTTSSSASSPSSSSSSESSKVGGRWPLLIDPQLQGAKWVAAKEGSHGLITTRLTATGYLDVVAKAVETGMPLLIENLPEELDPVLLPLLTRQLVQKGGFNYINIGGSDVRYNSSFRLYLQTRLAAPHYGPEVAAQITLINFCVTEKGLESQLLGAVVAHERPELQQQASILTSQLAEYSITLKNLEDKLLAGLAASEGDILEDIELIQSLEQTKATAVEVATKVQQAHVTGARLTAAREVFRPVAARGAAMYFIMDSLPLLNRVYCYSMANFMQLLKRGMDACSGGGRISDSDAEEEGDDSITSTTTTGGGSTAETPGNGDNIQKKVIKLTKLITASFYSEVCQGLFEKHKLSVAVQLAFTVLKERGELALLKWTYLLKGSSSSISAAAPLHTVSSTILAPEWLQRGGAWTRLLALSLLEGFASIPEEIASSGSKRWKEWMECSLPEETPLPGEWKRASHLDKLLILKALRPDRLAPAFYNFVAIVIGQQYATPPASNIQVALNHASPSIPVLFFLSPGVDIAGAVEAAARQGHSGEKSKATVEEQRLYVTVSLGQGQEELAMAALKKAREYGGWVLLQNIHLTIDWTSTALARFIDALDVGSDAGAAEGGGGGGGSQTNTTNTNTNTPHPDFRLLLSAEPPPSLEQPLPTSLLQACIKVTNEPPRGLKANLLRSLSLLDEDLIEGCSRPAELKSIMFALSFFHAAILERKRFGVGNKMSSKSGLGWNMDYPFSAGDLRCCVAIAANALENASVGGRLPWEDMRYMFGEIVYGGHIVENWDRRLARAYLESIFNDGLLSPGAELFPGLALPLAFASSSGTGTGGGSTAVANAMAHVEKNMPAENPRAFGLNQNADTTCLLAEASSLCDDLVVLAPKSSSDGDDNGDGNATSTKEKPTTTTIGSNGLQAMLVEDIVRRLPEVPSADDIRSRTGDSSGAPFAAVLLQECHAMYTLISKIKSNLGELELAINGQLTMSLQLEALAASITDDVVPKAWLAAAGSPSLRSLSSWIDQLGSRAAQLAEWALTDPATPPKSVWLGGLSNPQAFLTAVIQTAARRNGWALDRTALVTEVTRKNTIDQIDSPIRDGAYVHGLWLEGASWDDGTGGSSGIGGGGALMDGRPGELTCQMPLLLLKAVPVEKAELKDVYECPVYWTQCRFRQEVFTAQLKTKQSWVTWTKAGVSMFLDV